MSKEVEELFKQEHEVKSYKQSCFNGVKEIEYHCGQIVTDDIFSKEEMIAFAKFCADESKKGYKFCPYCGNKLRGIVETDANSKKVCKYIGCKPLKN